MSRRKKSRIQRLATVSVPATAGQDMFSPVTEGFPSDLIAREELKGKQLENEKRGLEIQVLATTLRPVRTALLNPMTWIAVISMIGAVVSVGVTLRLLNPELKQAKIDRDAAELGKIRAELESKAA